MFSKCEILVFNENNVNDSKTIKFFLLKTFSELITEMSTIYPNLVIWQGYPLAVFSKIWNWCLKTLNNSGTLKLCSFTRKNYFWVDCRKVVFFPNILWFCKANPLQFFSQNMKFVFLVKIQFRWFQDIKLVSLFI